MTANDKMEVYHEREGLTDIRAIRRQNGVWSFWTVRDDCENLRDMLPEDLILELADHIRDGNK